MALVKESGSKHLAILSWIGPRIEASRGSVYITNIPPGTVVLKITSDLGVYVTSVSLEAGVFRQSQFLPRRSLLKPVLNPLSGCRI